MTSFDSRLIALNLFYLAWIVLIPFSSQVLGDHGGDEPAVILYAFVDPHLAAWLWLALFLMPTAGGVMRSRRK